MIESTLKVAVSHPTQVKNILLGLLLGGCTLAMTACQTTQQIKPSPTSSVVTNSQPQYRELLKSFNIRGKIGITMPQTETSNAQSGSVFYVWAQEDARFAIDLTGAMGIGHTVIKYDGATATLVNQSVGELKANSPEELLQQATGWQAPISQLRYWISGRPAPSDANSQLDAQGRLISSENAGWVATFSYENDSAQSQIPNKIKVVRNDGHRVIMTINHSQNS